MDYQAEAHASINPLRGEEVAQEVLSSLSTELGIPSQQLLAVMRDRASVNVESPLFLLCTPQW